MRVPAFFSRPSVGRSALAAVVLLSAVAGGLLRCGADLNTGGDTTERPPHELLGIQIVPINDVLLVDLNQAATKELRVQAVYADGVIEDITRSVTIENDNPAIGTLADGFFTSVVKSTAQVGITHFSTRFGAAGQEHVAVANLTVVWLRTTGPATDFFFSLPFGTPAAKQPLSFSTNIQSIDSFFAVDTTASMLASINNLRTSLKGMIIPSVKAAAVKDAWFGVGAIDDFPQNPYGIPTASCTGDVQFLDDQPFILVSPMTTDVNLAQAATDKLVRGGASPRGCGGDIPESHLEALYQIATGEGNVVSGVVNVPAHNTIGRGGVEFRPGALPVITVVTDASFHTKGETNKSCQYFDAGFNLHNDSTEYGGAVATAAHTRAQTTAALNKLCAKVVGVAPQITTLPASCLPNSDLTQLARDTGTLVPPEAWDATGRPAGCNAGQCCTGVGGVGEAPGGDGLCPLVFKIKNDGTGLGQQVTTGITQVARYATFDVSTAKSGNTVGDKGETLPPGKTTADFLKAITPNSSLVPQTPPVPKPPVIAGGAFTLVTPGTVVRFDISAANDFQPETDQPQVFRATIKVLAGGCADLDQREVILLIPPKQPIVG